MELEEQTIGTPLVTAPEKAEGEGVSESELALVQRILSTIRGDRAHHKDAFEKMREDMQLATHGHNKNWPKGHYVANIVGRHVKQKTAALYAKNPKIVARRKETLDFTVWDENPDSLMMAYQQVQMAQQAMAVAPTTVDPMTGQMVPPPPPPGLEQALAVMQDFETGMAHRQEMSRLARTLEVLFNHEMRAQLPLDFKMGMKKLVRRTGTTGVGYVELAFSRETGMPPVVSQRIDDARARLAHLNRLAKDAQEGEIEEISAEMHELEISLTSLQQEELVVLHEGLVFDYPQSTRVIPDKSTTSLVGFIGARHLTIEYLFTPEEVREQFPEANLDKGFTPYKEEWRGEDDRRDAREEATTDSNGREKEAGKGGMVRVYKHFDKPTGMVYYVAEGHPYFLRAPAPPDVFVETFWPVFALTFNEVESEKELFPPSDARLMQHQQFELNRSRQGQREHREAARPRFVAKQGMIEQQDKVKLSTAQPFDVIDLNLTPEQKISDAFDVIPVPGVDPNLYETSPFFQDMQLVVGSQHATLGGIAKATATESAIAANSMAASDGSSVDDLDNFLTAVARAGGQILLREMSAERVTAIVGPGAFWPEMTLDQIADELFLEIEAGSSGKPNQAVEIDNWKQLLPMMINLPGIQPLWLAKETVRRLDDKVDLTDAVAAGIPSIAMMNQTAGAPGATVSNEDPNANPQAQGPEGGNNAPSGPSMVGPGTDAAFGSNQM